MPELIFYVFFGFSTVAPSIESFIQINVQERLNRWRHRRIIMADEEDEFRHSFVVCWHVCWVVYPSCWNTWSVFTRRADHHSIFELFSCEKMTLRNNQFRGSIFTPVNRGDFKRVYFKFEGNRTRGYRDMRVSNFSQFQLKNRPFLRCFYLKSTVESGGLQFWKTYFRLEFWNSDNGKSCARSNSKRKHLYPLKICFITRDMREVTFPINLHRTKLQNGSIFYKYNKFEHFLN